MVNGVRSSATCSVAIDNELSWLGLNIASSVLRRISERRCGGGSGGGGGLPPEKIFKLTIVLPIFLILSHTK